MNTNKLSRRGFLKMMLAGGAALGAGALLKNTSQASGGDGHDPHGPGNGMEHDGNMTVGEVDLSAFNPTEFLENFDWGTTSTLPDGRTLREWEVYAIDKEIAIAPGVFFPAGADNGQVPGPPFRSN